jgi:hypothetical protein
MGHVPNAALVAPKVSFGSISAVWGRRVNVRFPIQCGAAC